MQFLQNTASVPGKIRPWLNVRPPAPRSKVVAKARFPSTKYLILFLCFKFSNFLILSQQALIVVELNIANKTKRILIKSINERNPLHSLTEKFFPRKNDFSRKEHLRILSSIQKKTNVLIKKYQK